jgi:PilZ domain
MSTNSGGESTILQNGQCVYRMPGASGCQLEMHSNRHSREKGCTFGRATISPLAEPAQQGTSGNSRVGGEVPADSGFGPGTGVVWPLRCGNLVVNSCLPDGLVPSSSSLSTQKRKWARLQLAIPVFVRSRGENGKDLLEFATAVNISAGGALVVVRRTLPKATMVSLEIPSAPLGPASGLPRSSRAMRAKTVWISHLDGYHLLGMKFTRPLSTDAATVPQSLRRKAASVV